MKIKVSILSIIAAFCFASAVAFWSSRVNRSPAQAAAAIPAKPKMCLALKGNGEKVFVTMSALARITENFGFADAIAGGSSGAIAAFLYESMNLNPALNSCKETPCSDRSLRLRMGLLLKSFEGYVQYMENTPEVRGLMAAPRIAEEKKSIGLDLKDMASIAASLFRFLTSPDYSDVINPQLISELLHFDILHPDRSKELAKRLIQVEKAAKNTVIDSESIYLLIQDSIPNMDAVTRSVGQIGDFYAGYGPADFVNWKKFLDTCAESSEGKTWDQLVASSTCGNMFSDLAKNYHSHIVLKAEPRRLTENVGAHLRTLVPVSLLVGRDLVANYANAKKAYDAFQTVSFKIPSTAYRLGYFGRSLDLVEIAKNNRHYKDYKTSHFFPLPEYTWHEAMFRTISEPGLSNLLALNSEVLTAGGWSDSAPVLPLRNLGCDDVIFITRRGGEDSFSQKIASLLGLSDSDRASLLGIEPSQDASLPSLGLALKEASAVWCTNWNADSITGAGIPGMAIDGYTAPLQVNVPAFLQPYANASASTGFEGCVPPKSL